MCRSSWRRGGAARQRRSAARRSREARRARAARAAAAAGPRPAGRLRAAAARAGRRRRRGDRRGETSPWPLRRERLYAVPGDSPLGFRLPLASLPDVLPGGRRAGLSRSIRSRRATRCPARRRSRSARRSARAKPAAPAPKDVIKTALCVEVRDGHVHVFMPPLMRLEDYVALLGRDRGRGGGMQAAGRDRGLHAAARSARPGAERDARSRRHRGQRASRVVVGRALRHRPRRCTRKRGSTRLATEKFMLDGRHTGTGGGNHVTLGGATPADSPLLRRPDLLQSLVTYWQNHPALSYLFSGMFIGPTSQAPRVDEARDDRLYELEIAFQQMRRTNAAGETTTTPWLVDRLLRHLLTDLTGNTHRAEFSIDKLYSPDTSDRPPGPARISRVRDAAARADEPRADRCCCARSSRASGSSRTAATSCAGARRCTIDGCCRISSRPTCATSSPISTAFGYPLAPELVRSVRRVPLSALRHDHLRRRHDRTAAGDRAVARAGRGSERHGHRALCRFVGRAAAGQGYGNDRRAALGRPATAARCRSRRPAFPANTSPACASARGARRPRCIRRSACRRRSCSISSTRGRSARLAAARTMSRIRAAATTTRFRSTPTKPRRAASRASGRMATRRARCRCADEPPQSGDADDARPALGSADVQSMAGDPDPLRAEPDGLPASWRRAHGALRVGVCAPAWRNLHPAHRGHGRRALHAGGRAGDPRRDGLARPRLRRGPVLPDAADGSLPGGPARDGGARPRLPLLHAAGRARRTARGADGPRREAALRRSLAARECRRQDAAGRCRAGDPVQESAGRQRGLGRSRSRAGSRSPMPRSTTSCSRGPTARRPTISASSSTTSTCGSRTSSAATITSTTRRGRSTSSAPWGMSRRSLRTCRPCWARTATSSPSGMAPSASWNTRRRAICRRRWSTFSPGSAGRTATTKCSRARNSSRGSISTRISAAPSRFNADKLKWLNQEHMKRLPEAELGRRLVPYLERAGLDPAAGPAPARRGRAACAIASRRSTEMAAAARYFYVAPQPARRTLRASHGQ